MLTLLTSVNLALSIPTTPVQVPVGINNTLYNTPVTSFPFLQKEAHDLNEVELLQFVDLALSERLTVGQAASFLQRLNKDQLENIANIIARRKPLNRNLLSQKISHPTKNLDNSSYRNKNFLGKIGTQLGNSLLSFNSGKWNEWIENTWVRWRPSRYAYPSYWYKSQYTCDHKFDTDFVFHFNYKFKNKKSLRWTTDSTAVYTVLMSAYKGKLNSYSYNHDQVKICIGDKTVFWAGGANHVFKTIYIHSK